MENLDRFLGKVCTVLTGPTPFPFRDPMQHAQFFTGRVVEVDAGGVWIRHLNTETLAFYAFPLVGIVEEQIIAKDDPRHAKVTDEVQKKAPPVKISPNNFTSVEEMTRKINQMNVAAKSQ